MLVHDVIYTIWSNPDKKERVRFNSWADARAFERENMHTLRSCDIERVTVQDVFSLNDLIAKQYA